MQILSKTQTHKPTINHHPTQSQNPKQNPHQQPSPKAKQQTQKTPPTYPFPDYTIVKEQNLPA
jgi:hypothetical protein